MNHLKPLLSTFMIGTALFASTAAVAAPVTLAPATVQSIELSYVGSRHDGVTIEINSNENPHRCRKGGGLYVFSNYKNNSWDKALTLAILAKETGAQIELTLTGCLRSGYPLAKGIKLLKQEK